MTRTLAGNPVTKFTAAMAAILTLAACDVNQDDYDPWEEDYDVEVWDLAGDEDEDDDGDAPALSFLDSEDNDATSTTKDELDLLPGWGEDDLAWVWEKPTPYIPYVPPDASGTSRVAGGDAAVAVNESRDPSSARGDVLSSMWPESTAAETSYVCEPTDGGVVAPAELFCEDAGLMCPAATEWG